MSWYNGFVTYKGRDIKNPLISIPVVILAILVATTIVWFAILTAPLWFPVNYVLKRCGRKGFIRRHPNGGIKIGLARNAFEKE